MKRSFLIIIAFFAMSHQACAQCSGWPVNCTGIHPSTAAPSGVNPAAAAGAASAGWAIGTAIGNMLAPRPSQAQIDATAWTNKGTEFYNVATQYTNHPIMDCANALPWLRKAEFSYEQAKKLDPNDEVITRYLHNAQTNIYACEHHRSIRQGAASNPVELAPPDTPPAQTVTAQLGQCRATYADCLKNVEATIAKSSDKVCGSTPSHDVGQSACIAMELIRQHRAKAECLSTRNSCYRQVENNERKIKQKIKRIS